MSTAGSPLPPGNGPAGPQRGAGGPRTFQPARAAAVVLVSIGVGVAVLARMGGTPHSALASTTVTTVGPSTTSTTGPTTPTTVGGSTTTTTTLPAGHVTVLVLNGGSTYHAALYFQTKLAADGYDTLAPSDALTATNKLTDVFVVNPAAQANAVAIAQLLQAAPSSVLTPTATNDSAVPVAMQHAADVIVVVGADISGHVPPHFNTTTTVAPTTSTS